MEGGGLGGGMTSPQTHGAGLISNSINSIFVGWIDLKSNMNYKFKRSYLNE